MATNRIEWSLDGKHLASCVAGVLRVHDLAGASTILDGPDLLDARWHGDALVGIDRHGTLRWYRDGGGTEPVRISRVMLAHASIARDRDVVLAIAAHATEIVTFEDKTVWTLDRYKHAVGVFEDRTSAALSPDGAIVAIGYETRAAANYSYERREGRGWLVIDTAKDRVVDRSWSPTRRSLAPLGFAFDAKRKRLAIASPEAGTTIGMLRIDRDDKYARTHLGGARAVALDDRGVLAAYAYPPGVGERRLRVDYLEPGAKGGSAIAIVDTLWIDPALDDIVAVAFDRQSRRIACIDAKARVDVVPVP